MCFRADLESALPFGLSHPTWSIARSVLRWRGRSDREGREATKSIGPHLLKWLSDPRLLREAWNLLARSGGLAPGPNGRRYDDLDAPEVWALLKTIGQAIRNDTYRVDEVKTVQIPKDRTDTSRGTRPISLLNIEDRVVQRAVVEVLQPLLDGLFGRNILGFRPGHGRLQALALAEKEVVTEGRYVLVVADIRDAFTRVPLGRLMDLLARHIPSQEVLRLLGRLLDTGEKHGIRQGGPLSPLLLNFFLHHVLDKPWREMENMPPMIRVADDILLLCRSRKEAIHLHAALQARLAPANMSLKQTQKSTIFDLRKGEAAEWLGFEIHKGQEGLEVKIAKKAWKRLAEHLALAHEKPDAPVIAASIIEGWIEQMGPCYPFVNRYWVYRRLAVKSAEQAFDDIPSRDAILSRWRRAHERWGKIRVEVRENPAILDTIYGARNSCGDSGTSVAQPSEERHPETSGARVATEACPSYMPPWE